jgi:indolepyruvate ferredoxin oxidoreductase beta subunit
LIRIVTAGVGGQGVLTISRILGVAALKAGLDVMISELHGLAQRGGVVASNIKMGSRVYNSMIDLAEADLLVGLEMLETIRHINLLKKGGVAIVSETKILPKSSVIEKAHYPTLEEAVSLIGERTQDIHLINPGGVAIRLQIPWAENIVMLGYLSKVLENTLSTHYIREAISEVIPRRALEPNLKAFDEGRRTPKEPLPLKNRNI